MPVVAPGDTNKLVQVAQSCQKKNSARTKDETECTAAQPVADILGSRGAHLDELVDQEHVCSLVLFMFLSCLGVCETFNMTTLMLIPAVPSSRLKRCSHVPHPFEQAR